MNQQDKMQVQGKLMAANAHINVAKGMANMPAVPNTPTLALNPLVSALQDLHAAMKMLLDKA